MQRNTALQHCCDVVSNCFNIATLCCAKNRRCESSRVTSPLASEGSDDANLGTCSKKQQGVQMAKFLECKFVGVSQDFLLLHKG